MESKTASTLSVASPAPVSPSPVSPPVTPTPMSPSPVPAPVVPAPGRIYPSLVNIERITNEIDTLSKKNSDLKKKQGRLQMTLRKKIMSLDALKKEQDEFQKQIAIVQETMDRLTFEVDTDMNQYDNCTVNISNNEIHIKNLSISLESAKNIRTNDARALAGRIQNFRANNM